MTLTGELVTLEPLRPEHHDELVAAAGDGRLWELWYTSVPDPEGMAADISARLARQAAGEMLPFTVRSAAGAVVGMTTYLNVEPEAPRLEIGGTWTAASAQRTGVNTESKLLLLGHAFDVLGCIAVEFRTHWHNRRSRAAVERLGAKQDGVLRNHRRLPDGSLRDTVVYSILDSEWPAVRAGLRHRLARGR
ncbi:GNAT family N-acetyltransferase [Geodermatophilus sabuli]|uniref:GNAT family N-acetyltransferase n=1 Tax=Geodermatophilus sabuli TaxID=1564158 RepID=UPI0031F2F9FC